MLWKKSWQKLLWRGLVMISLPLALVLLMLWRPDYQPPIFDAQVHYNKADWQRVRVEAIVNGIRELNVRWLLVGSTPNEGTWRLANALPDRVIPMWIPETKRDSRDQWMHDPEQLAAMTQEFQNKPYRGVGELWLAHGDIQSEGVQQLVELASEKNLVLHLRTDPVAIRSLFTIEPTLKILWAHAGVYADAAEVESLLWQYPNLWIELSHRHDATPQGNLNPDWRELILNHADRVLVGTGTYNADYWYQYRTILSNHRQWLSGLPEEVALKVAYLNGEGLFGMVGSTVFQKRSP